MIILQQDTSVVHSCMIFRCLRASYFYRQEASEEYIIGHQIGLAESWHRTSSQELAG